AWHWRALLLPMPRFLSCKIPPPRWTPLLSRPLPSESQERARTSRPSSIPMHLPGGPYKDELSWYEYSFSYRYLAPNPQGLKQTLAGSTKGNSAVSFRYCVACSWRGGQYLDSYPARPYRRCGHFS